MARRWPIQRVPRELWSAQEPTFSDAAPAVIEAAAKRAGERPSGNWFVFAASTDIRADRPFGTRVGGRELVAWRDRHGTLLIGPGECPHLGAPLAHGRVVCGTLVCRWHGMPVGADGRFGWEPWPAHDDGVLAWVRLDGPEAPLAEPVLPPRPALADSVAAVARLDGVCEPEDVIANRLDPWHGSWFHPYSFTHLKVRSVPEPQDDRFVVDVTFRVAPGAGVPVRAEFACPEPRTVVMTIVEGEGAGSVVETHATPLGPGPDGRPRTAVIEAVIATSGRTGFPFARKAAPALRPLMRRAAARLWRDDLAYAERRYALRS
ncbi:DUF5914 domain-containing protein [Amycolatopsis pithecellobii]|uniref:Rieske 2Fe-2S domain-containing protein n=1 Tax=Amycolatopsis pithecellobii TaxID=664692 RepID=A0A6N7ZD64_9PSEU|nr:DUF5914 domain-containing protein [Amycolatopsis pithecellobii]MTD59626.1 Rieske 2Fe-2S domain-containing protein [Amycolatopsis pithecellobii]